MAPSKRKATFVTKPKTRGLRAARTRWTKVKATKRSQNRPTMPPLVFELLTDHLSERACSVAGEFSGIINLIEDIPHPRKLRKLLSNLSLVQRSWRVHAQAALHRRVILRTEKSMTQFLATHDYRATERIQELQITHSFEDARNLETLRMIDNVRNMRTTFTSAFERLSGDPASAGMASYMREIALVESIIARDLPRRKHTQQTPRIVQISRLVTRTPNLRFLSIEIGSKFNEVEAPGALESMLGAISGMAQLEGLTLTCNDIYKNGCPAYPYFSSLCRTISKLRQLKLLRIANWTCKKGEEDEELDEELKQCTPPTGLKTIIMHLVEDPLPKNFVSWLLCPNGAYEPAHLMLTAPEDAHFFTLDSDWDFSSLKSLHVDIEAESHSGASVTDFELLSTQLQSFVSSCPILDYLHLPSIHPLPSLILPPTLKTLSVRCSNTINHAPLLADEELRNLIAHTHSTQRESGSESSHTGLQKLTLRPSADDLGMCSMFELPEDLEVYFPKTMSVCRERGVAFVCEQEMPMRCGPPLGVINWMLRAFPGKP